MCSHQSSLVLSVVSNSLGSSRKVTRKVYDICLQTPHLMFLSVSCIMCWPVQLYALCHTLTECLAAVYIENYESDLINDIHWVTRFCLALTFGPHCHCIFCRFACCLHIPSRCSLLPPSFKGFKGSLLSLLVCFLNRHTFHCFLRCFIFPRPGKKQLPTR